MAIVQISRITNRKGYTEDLPQLAGAELGWCVDSRRLFIGNGTLQDGAPEIGNTEILTQYSNITALSNYTYADIAVGYAAQTGPTSSTPVVRTVQAKLDDMASVRDFGAVGDGVADDTAAISRAFYQLYCRENNTQIRRSLFFPAGTYRITDTIVIPTYARLVGEGINSSIILLQPDDSSIPDYVAQYGDSRQQTGASIGNNGATPPTNIEINNMAFQSAISTNVFLVDQATQCSFNSVGFVGNVTLSELTAAGATPLNDNFAVGFASIGSNICNNIVFDQCAFTNIKYGIHTDALLNSAVVSNSQFSTVYRGIVLDSNVTGFRAVHNFFDNVYYQGIVYDQVSLNVSAFNIFYNVGNSIGSTNPTSAVISFGNDNNVSSNDLFARTDDAAYEIPRVEILSTSAATGGTLLQMGQYVREGGRSFTLDDNSVNQTILNVNSEVTRAFQMQYTIVRDAGVRTGTLTVTSAPTDSTPASYTDDYTENEDCGVTLAVDQSVNQVSVEYTTTSTGFDGSMTYSIAHLA